MATQKKKPTPKPKTAMTPGSRMVTAKAMKAGVKAMDVAKATAMSRSDAAKPIGNRIVEAKWSPSTLKSAILQYEGYLRKGKFPPGLSRARVQSALDSMYEQVKGKGK